MSKSPSWRKREHTPNAIPCNCGRKASLYGRYCTESGLKTYHYRISCNCGRKVTLFGDIWTSDEIIQKFNRRFNHAATSGFFTPELRR